MKSYKNFIVVCGFVIQKYPLTKFEQDQANIDILANMQVSSLFYSTTHSLQKVAMATPEINENCHYVQNDPHRYEIKHEKFDFDILCCFVFESPRGFPSPPPRPGEININI